MRKSEFSRSKPATILFWVCLLCVFTNGLRGEEDERERFRSDIDPAFFLSPKNSSLALGVLTEARKKFPPSFGASGEFFIAKRNEHLWKTSFVYVNHRTAAETSPPVHQTYAGFGYSFVSRENSFSSSLFAGWERGHKDLCVIGFRLEIPTRQSIHLFGKTGEEFRNVSLVLHSPLNRELRLFAGVSRTWTEAQTEDRFTLGIGFAWDNAAVSFFGNQSALDKDASFSARADIGDLFEKDSDSRATRISSGNRIDHASEATYDRSSIKNTERSEKHDLVRRSPIHRYTNVSFTLQELLSAGFSLAAALRISRESARSRNEFAEFFHSLSEKEQAKIYVLLKKKNPAARPKAAPNKADKKRTDTNVRKEKP
ncbi:hypothetical protein [Leptospira yasudae]|uniref:hypothetical protein n=1 Tax=Leptospira yasudae TaxID=2202201 RepID=UPI00298FAAA0|nr:hypothetical protein [Leptospira yasudae]